MYTSDSDLKNIIAFFFSGLSEFFFVEQTNPAVLMTIPNLQNSVDKNDTFLLKC